MKKNVLLLMACAGIMMLGACKEKKAVKDTAEYAESYEIPKVVDPIDMSQPTLKVAVTWQGVPCHAVITSHASDSVTVKNEFGQKYKDNIFEVQLIKDDGTSLYRRSLNKRMFLSYIKDAEMRATFSEKAILKNVSPELNENGKFLYFNVSLQDPEAVDDQDIVFKMFTDGTIEEVEFDDGYRPQEGEEYEDEGI